MNTRDLATGFVAGVLSSAALAYFFFKSQIPPPNQP